LPRRRRGGAGGGAGWEGGRGNVWGSGAGPPVACIRLVGVPAYSQLLPARPAPDSSGFDVATPIFIPQFLLHSSPDFLLATIPACELPVFVPKLRMPRTGRTGGLLACICCDRANRHNLTLNQPAINTRLLPTCDALPKGLPLLTRFDVRLLLFVAHIDVLHTANAKLSGGAIAVRLSVMFAFHVVSATTPRMTLNTNTTGSHR